MPGCILTNNKSFYFFRLSYASKLVVWFGLKRESSNGGSNDSTFKKIYFCQKFKKNGF